MKHIPSMHNNRAQYHGACTFQTNHEDCMLPEHVDLIEHCEKMGLAELTGKNLNTLDVIYAVYLMGQGGLGGAMLKDGAG